MFTDDLAVCTESKSLLPGHDMSTACVSAVFSHYSMQILKFIKIQQAKNKQTTLGQIKLFT